MKLIEDMASFRWRLAETIAWCAPRGSLANPIYSLRTPALQPAVFESVELLLEELPAGRIVETAALIQPIVEVLAQERALQLQQNGSYPRTWAEDLAGGRLLLYDPRQNLADGAATEVSAGFFGYNNIPAWDTWVFYVHDSTKADQRSARVYDARADHQGESHIGSLHDDYFRTCLMSWIPPQFVPLVTAGINVNPELCIAWAEDLDIPLTRWLQMEGLLPEWLQGTIEDS